ncbi:MAG: FecR domain-containing protein [Pirellulales bacterium]|nr:FecR domain-containing protein [Pirellulales bacterium]
MRSNANHAELHDLLTCLCDAELDRPDWERLETLLLDNPDAQDYYSRFMALDVDLAWRAADNDQGLGVGDQGSEGRGQRTEGREQSTDIQILSPLPSPLSPQFVGGPVFSYMVATVVLCLMLLGGWAYKINYDRYIFTADSRRSTTFGSLEQQQLVFVGRITGMKDCRWSDLDTQTILGASTSLGREYALTSGLLEITYQSGAKVILEGPCTYKVESSAGGFLARGKLTANIRTHSSKPKAQSSEPSPLSPLSPLSSPLFAVRTPTALITDLGTEFGVEVDDDGRCFVRVYEGVVEAALIEKDGAIGTPKRITADQVAKIVRNANMYGVNVVDASRDAVQFVRELPSLLICRHHLGATGEFSVAADDLIAAGSQTLSDIKLIRGEIIHKGGLSKLHDGDVYGNKIAESTFAAVTPLDGSVVEVALNTADQPSGYDVFSIVSLTGCAGRAGNQDRSSQKYDVAYSTVDAPDDFVLLRCDRETTVNRNARGWSEMQITLSCGGLRPIAQRVAKLRFTFHDTDSEFPESAYREIDVFGSPSNVPKKYSTGGVNNTGNDKS